MLISDLTNAAPLKTDLMEFQRGQTSSNNATVAQLATAFADETIVAEYDSTATYSIGDYCVYGGVLYRCTTAIAVAEAWTAGHWTAVLVTGEYMRVRVMHKAAYDALSADEKASGMIFIDDYDPNPSSHVEQTTSQAVADATAVALNSPTYTIPSDGLYLIIGFVAWEGAMGGNRSLRINSSLSGVTENSEYTTNESALGIAIRMQTTWMKQLSAGAVLSMGVRQNSGSSINITYAYLDIIKLK